MKNIFLALMLLTVLYSCGQYKRFTYIQPEAARLHDSIYNKSFIFYKLQPADILRVNVQSMDKNITEVFNDNGSGSSNSSQNSASGNSGYLMGHSVDIDGNINLPVMGKIQVAGKSVDEARDLIQVRAEEYIKDAKVIVKLLSFKVYFLGEVGGGMQTIYSDRANILECISMAGDISYNGNRKKVTILRSYQQVTKVIEVDLTRRDLLSSPLYYLQPNDIVYVEPLKTTMFRMRLTEYASIMSFFTSAIAVVVLITNLK